ncbi:phosphatase PAP2 family protein [Actinomadura montaniterrae]|uniref:Phosphatase PAP2 family protein n=1 Tax=Actinomadura montaniterrae TaxID=1803903 RepID=A0A6L3W2L4_9ACTN|nr:phosphatase PAP2 family protein [Actinomadura montaniterrae]KAB2388461.1 phosphatase PAP2 family protein [Actinomadura montaniterrae]
MRRRSWGWYLVAVAVMAGVTADVLADGPLRRLDWTVHTFCDAHVRGGWMSAVHVFTQLGQRGVIAGYVLVPLAILGAVRARSARPVLVPIVVVALLSLLQEGVKSVIPRTYPLSDVDVLWKHGDAYPSGHTLNGFLLVWVGIELLVVVVPALDRWLTARGRRDFALVTGFLTGAALTAADEHWLTDVLFSLALGPVLLAGLVAAEPFTRRLWAGEPVRGRYPRI